MDVGPGSDGSLDHLRLMFLVGSRGQWTLNDGPYEFAGGSLSLLRDDVARARDRILRVLRRQSVDSLSRSECVVLGRNLELPVSCLVDGEERSCRLVSVDRVLAGSCGGDTLSIYSPVHDELPRGQSLLFLRNRGPGVFTTASFHAGAIATREGKAQRTGTPLSKLIRQIEIARKRSIR